MTIEAHQAPERVLPVLPTGGAVFFDPLKPGNDHLRCSVSIPQSLLNLEPVRIGSLEAVVPFYFRLSSDNPLMKFPELTDKKAA